MAHDWDVKEPLTLGDGRKFTAEYGGFDYRSLDHTWWVIFDGQTHQHCVQAGGNDDKYDDPSVRLSTLRSAVEAKFGHERS